MKVKLFWKRNSIWEQGFGSITNNVVLENEINAWLQGHPNIKIADIRQSASGGSWGPMVWLISVWYEEGDS